jgi:mono/diheme cytochrome c family protein
MTRSALTCILLAAMLLNPLPGAAQDDEWPGLYFEKCGRCHGDAHALLDERAVLRGDILVGRSSGKDLRAFLDRHFGRRDEEQVAKIYMELTRVAQGGGRFRQQCAICHVSAEALARESLVLRDGKLFGRYSGRRIADFLIGHGRLETSDDAAFFEEVLRRNMPARR